MTRDIDRTFFYAAKEAPMYDETIEWVAPCYRQMHETMLKLAVKNYSESNQRAGKGSKRPPIALDMGCGTGAEAVGLLQQIPELRLMGIDLCEPMLHEFAQNANRANVDKARYVLKHLDILAPEATNEIRKAANETFGTEQFQISISAFTFHHFDESERKSAFGKIFNLLTAGGIFLLGDLFNYDEESTWLTQTTKNWELDFITNNFDREIGKDPQAAEGLTKLKNEWVRHYRVENRLSGMQRQMRELRDAGFVDVGSPFRYWQVGLVFAKKPNPNQR
ncbi:MAG: hypothetical protein FD164_2398 [Nitrospirae bacterium]|nr:MAG: hypothetical protein FD164_2398 [Nitrospirota bacterium]